MRPITCRLVPLMVFLVFCTLLVSGCQNVETFYVGSKISNAESVALQSGGPHQDVWENFDVVIPYTYENRADTLEIFADARLGEHYRTLYERLNRLDLYLYFLDSTNTIVSTALLKSAFVQSTEDLITFKRSLPMPAGTTAFAFGYQGSVSSRGDSQKEPGSSAFFNKLPHR